MTTKKSSSVVLGAGNGRKRGLKADQQKDPLAAPPLETSDVATLSHSDVGAMRADACYSASEDIQTLRAIDRLLFVAGYYDTVVLRKCADDLFAP